MDIQIEQVTVEGVEWYEVTISIGKNTQIVKRLSESEIKQLRDQIESILKLSGD